MRKILSLFVAFLGSMLMYAATETTVYYAVPQDVVGNYRVMLNINLQGDGDNWKQTEMSPAPFGYQNDVVFAASFTDLYDGVGVMQFQLFEGENWVSQVEVINTWTFATEYNNKIFVHTLNKWVTLNDPGEGEGGNEEEPQVRYYITGNDALVGEELAWNPAAIAVYADEYVFSLAAGDYQLKVTLDGTWNEGMVKGYNNLTKAQDGLTTDDSDNILFTLAEAGDVTVKFNATRFTVTGNFKTEQDIPVVENETIDVFYVNTLDWQKVYAYVFEGEKSNVEWPGEVMTPINTMVNNHSVWAYSFPANYKVFIANNGEGAQTPDMEIPEGMSILCDGAWYASFDEIPVMENETIDVFYVNDKDWQNVYAYVFEGNNVKAEWPGEMMTPINTMFNHHSVYAYTFPANYKVFIANNGEGEQTPDMQLQEGKSILYDGAWYASFDEIPVEENPSSVWYITGTGNLVGEGANAWDEHAIAVDGQEHILNLVAGQYAMKIVVNGEWLGYDALTDLYKGITTDDDRNVVFTLAEDGVVTVTYTGDIFTVIGNFVTEPVVEPDVHYYLVGEFNDWDIENAPEFAFANGADFYSIGLKEMKGAFKVTTARNWNEGNYGAYNEGEVLALGGEYVLNGDNAQNLNLDGLYQGVILNLMVSENGMMLKFVEGTLVEEPVVEPENVTVYFINTKGWEQVNAYVWNSENDGALVEWPGKPMEMVDMTYENNAIYTFSFPDTYNYVIFNNGDAQTGDYEIVKVKPYMYNDVWYASLDEITSGEPTVNFYITGNEALVGEELAWQPNAIPVSGDTYVAELSTGMYSMKVSLDGTWSDGMVKGYGDLTEMSEGVTTDDNGNINFVIENKSKVMVIYNENGFSITGDFYTGEIVEPTVKYYITGNAALVGEDKAWKADAIASEEELYTFESLTAGTYSLKVTLDGTWNDGMVRGYYDLTTQVPGITTDDDGNINFTMKEEGIVSVLFNADEFIVRGNFFVEEQPEAAYYLVGDFNDWDIENAPAFDRDAAGNYFISLDEMAGGFKVAVARNWDEVNYGAYEEGDVIALGDEYVMIDNVTAMNQNLNLDGTYKGVVLNLYVSDNGMMLKFVEGTLVEEPVEEKVLYYITGSANLVGEELEWKPDAIAVTTKTQGYYEFLNLAAGDYKMKIVTLEGQWLGYDAVTNAPKGVTTDADGNICFTIADGTESVVAVAYTENGLMVRGNFYVEDQPVEDADYYLVGDFNEWDVENALPFTYDEQNEEYIIYLDVLYGGFKVVNARNWEGDNYGAYEQGDVLELDGEYELLSNENGNADLRVTGRYTKVMLTLQVNEEQMILNFVEGTLVEETEKAFYLVGAFNEWDIDNAPAFVYDAQNAIYTITLKEMAGEFKVTTARNWQEVNYGAYEEGDVIGIGGEYVMLDNVTAENHNLRLDGRYQGVMFNLTLTDNGPMLTMVEGEKEAEPTYVIFVTNTWEYVQPMAYIWYEVDGDNGVSLVNGRRAPMSDEYVAWPGEVMTKTEQTINGKEVYTYSFPEHYNMLVVNDGGENQSSDIAIDKNNNYLYEETWYADKQAVEEQIPTGLIQIMEKNNANKMMLNGQLYILRNGVIYNVQGTIVR